MIYKDTHNKNENHTKTKLRLIHLLTDTTLFYDENKHIYISPNNHYLYHYYFGMDTMEEYDSLFEELSKYQVVENPYRIDPNRSDLHIFQYIQELFESTLQKGGSINQEKFKNRLNEERFIINSIHNFTFNKNKNNKSKYDKMIKVLKEKFQKLHNSMSGLLWSNEKIKFLNIRKYKSVSNKTSGKKEKEKNQNQTGFISDIEKSFFRYLLYLQNKSKLKKTCIYQDYL
jgi:hypothetical protein